MPMLANNKKKKESPPALPTGCFYIADISEHPEKETSDAANLLMQPLERTYDILTNEEKIEPVTILNNAELSALYSMMRINRALGVDKYKTEKGNWAYKKGSSKSSNDELIKKMLTLKVSTAGKGREDLVTVMGGWGSWIHPGGIVEETKKKR